MALEVAVQALGNRPNKDWGSTAKGKEKMERIRAKYLPVGCVEKDDISAGVMDVQIRMSGPLIDL